MRTRLQPIRSLSRILHGSADIVFGNSIADDAHDLANTPLQEESSFTVSVPVPGMSKEDLAVHMQDQILVISTKQ